MIADMWWWIVPKYIFFLPPTEAFPKTASGKIQKFKLKEIAIKRLNEGCGGVD